jgi:hypothetical protein
MAWKMLTPSSVEELHAALVKLHENKQHVKSVKIDHANRVIRVDLDFLANTQVSDFMIPLKNGTSNDVDDIVKVMLNDTARGIAPSRAAAERIYQYVDSARY